MAFLPVMKPGYNLYGTAAATAGRKHTAKARRRAATHSEASSLPSSPRVPRSRPIDIVSSSPAPPLKSSLVSSAATSPTSPQRRSRAATVSLASPRRVHFSLPPSPLGSDPDYDPEGHPEGRTDPDYSESPPDKGQHPSGHTREHSTPLKKILMAKLKALSHGGRHSVSSAANS